MAFYNYVSLNLIHSPIHLLIHSLNHSLTHSLTQSITNQLTHLLTNSLNQPTTHRPPTHSVSHSSSHPPTNRFIQSLTHHTSSPIVITPQVTPTNDTITSLDVAVIIDLGSISATDQNYRFYMKKNSGEVYWLTSKRTDITYKCYLPSGKKNSHKYYYKYPQLKWHKL